MARLANNASRAPMIAAVGNIAAQTDTGISCKVSQAENAFSVPTRRSGPANPCENIKALPQMATPQPAIRLIPTMRHARGIRSQAVAAHSANALHMLME